MKRDYLTLSKNQGFGWVDTPNRVARRGRGPHRPTSKLLTGK